MSNKYPKSLRLRTRRQYQRLAHKSSRSSGRLVVVELCPNKQDLTRLGITASRHYGIAVKRNRFKRIVREAFRLAKKQLPSGFDINVKPRPFALKAKTADIMAELITLLQ